MRKVLFAMIGGSVVSACSTTLPLGLEVADDSGATVSRPVRVEPEAAPPDARVEQTAVPEASAPTQAPEAGPPEAAPEAVPDVQAEATSDAGADTLDASDGETLDSSDASAAAPEAAAPPPPGTCVPADCGTHSWACWRMPNSPNSGLPNPAHYTDMGDGTVRDDVTCLLWQKQAPATTAYTWSDAKLKCTQNPLLGGVGWRLPSRIELMSIVDYARRDPTIVLAVFPSTLQSPPYWTWSPLLGTADSYAISFHDGTVLHADQTTMYLARCVRGGGERQDLPGDAPNDHYAIGVDTVLDRYTVNPRPVPS